MKNDFKKHQAYKFIHLFRSFMHLLFLSVDVHHGTEELPIMLIQYSLEICKHN